LEGKSKQVNVRLTYRLVTSLKVNRTSYLNKRSFTVVSGLSTWHRQSTIRLASGGPKGMPSAKHPTPLQKKPDCHSRTFLSGVHCSDYAKYWIPDWSISRGDPFGTGM